MFAGRATMGFCPFLTPIVSAEELTGCLLHVSVDVPETQMLAVDRECVHAMRTAGSAHIAR